MSIILYVKGFNKTHKKNEFNQRENEMKELINLRKIEPVISLNQK